MATGRHLTQRSHIKVSCRGKMTGGRQEEVLFFVFFKHLRVGLQSKMATLISAHKPIPRPLLYVYLFDGSSHFLEEFRYIGSQVVAISHIFYLFFSLQNPKLRL
ncbi:hypothetical protein FKM82_021698 [Ascaphus truei]